MDSTALLAAAAAAALIALVGAASRRARRAAGRRRRRLADLAVRLDAVRSDLQGTVDRVREAALRTRLVESLNRVVDLEEAIARCAEAAALLPRVAGAVVRIELDGVPRVATAGVFDRPVGRGSSDDGPLRAAGVAELPPPGEPEQDERRRSVAVPLEIEGLRFGSLTVFGRGEEPPVTERERSILEAISHRGATGIEAARRLLEAGRLPSFESLTGLGTRTRFHGALAIEVARARRHGRRLAVCLLAVDDFRVIVARIGHVAADSLVAEIAQVLRGAVRPSDVACRTGGDEFAVILPESDRAAAERLVALLQGAAREVPAASGFPVTVSAGIAELEPDDDGVSLFVRAADALQGARTAGKDTAA